MFMRGGRLGWGFSGARRTIAVRVGKMQKHGRVIERRRDVEALILATALVNLGRSRRNGLIFQ